RADDRGLLPGAEESRALASGGTPARAGEAPERSPVRAPGLLVAVPAHQQLAMSAIRHTVQLTLSHNLSYAPAGGRTMRKFALQLGLGLAVLAFATASHARIFVIINDGVTGLNGSNLTGCDSFQKNDSNDPACFIGNFRLSRFSPQLPDTDTINDQTDVMPLLGCSPCTVYFPSASTTQQSTDTFAFSDTN